MMANTKQSTRKPGALSFSLNRIRCLRRRLSMGSCANGSTERRGTRTMPWAVRWQNTRAPVAHWVRRRSFMHWNKRQAAHSPPHAAVAHPCTVWETSNCPPIPHLRYNGPMKWLRDALSAPSSTTPAAFRYVMLAVVAVLLCWTLALYFRSQGATDLTGASIAVLLLINQLAWNWDFPVPVRVSLRVASWIWIVVVFALLLAK